MLLGVIADDFTGASDVANTLARGGMAAMQFIGTPLSDAPADCAAGVVALKTRSLPPREAVDQSLTALEWLKRQGCHQFLFKYCSTFDSTQFGNIGPVAEALLDALEAPVAVVCPVFPATGRTLFMGHLFVNGRLLNESGMERHPLTPMTDSDIRRWLRRQTRGDVGLVPYPVVHCGAEAIDAALAEEVSMARRLVVVDAVTDENLRTIGTAVAGHRLITGGSGIALGLPETFRRRGLITEEQPAFEGLAGPAVVLSGSCSTASRGQVAAYMEDHPGLLLDPARLIEGSLTTADVFDFVMANIATAPIVYSTADPTSVEETQGRFGQVSTAQVLESFFGELAVRLVKAGVVRLVIAGGETSGTVVTRLGIDRLRIGPEIDPGVPELAVEARPIRLALKSGNFGSPDFFEKALRVLEGA